MQTKTIIEEIIDWRTSELKAGRTPTEIRLSDDQRRRLKQWCESNQLDRSDPTRFSKDMMIFGMKVSKSIKIRASTVPILVKR
jgi:hypothetical protein